MGTILWYVGWSRGSCSPKLNVDSLAKPTPCLLAVGLRKFRQGEESRVSKDVARAALALHSFE